MYSMYEGSKSHGTVNYYEKILKQTLVFTFYQNRLKWVFLMCVWQWGTQRFNIQGIPHECVIYMFSYKNITFSPVNPTS